MKGSLFDLDFLRNQPLGDAKDFSRNDLAFIRDVVASFLMANKPAVVDMTEKYITTDLPYHKTTRIDKSSAVCLVMLNHPEDSSNLGQTRL